MAAYRVRLDGLVAVHPNMDHLVRLSEDQGHLCGVLGGWYMVLARDRNPDSDMVLRDVIAFSMATDALCSQHYPPIGRNDEKD